METLKERMTRALEEKKRDYDLIMRGETAAYEGKIRILKDLFETLTIMGIMDEEEKDANVLFVNEVAWNNAAPVEQDLTGYADNAIMLGWSVSHDDVTLNLHVGPFFSDGQGSDKYTFDSIPMWSDVDVKQAKTYGETPEKMVEKQIEANLGRLFHMLKKVEA